MKYATHNCCYLYSTVHHSTLQYTAPGCFLLPVFKATLHLSLQAPVSPFISITPNILTLHSQLCLPHQVYISSLLHWLFCCKKSPVAAYALFCCILPPTGQLQQLSLYITCNKQQLVGGDYYQLLQQVTSIMSPFYKGACSAKCGQNALCCWR